MHDPTPLRILLVTNGFPPGAMGGVETYSRHLALALRRAGQEVLVFCREEAPARQEGTWRDDDVDGLTVRRVVNNFERVSGFADYYVNLHTETLFTRFLAETQPDVVHFQHAIGLSATLPLAARVAGRPAVWTLWDYWPICPVNTLLLPDLTLCPGSHHPVNCFRCVYGSVRPLPGRHMPPEAGGDATAEAVRHPFGLTEGTMHTLRRRLPRSARLRLLSLYNVLQAGRHAVGERLSGGSRIAAAPELPPPAVRRRAEIMRQALGSCEALVAPLPFVAETYVEFGVRADVLQVVEPGMDVGAWPRLPRPARVPGRALRIGYIGSLMRHKGVDTLLEALALVASRDLELQLHGFFVPGDPYGDALRRSAGRDRRVRWMGPYEQVDLPGVLAGIDVLAMPARWHETFSFVTREAVLAGVPVLAADMGGMRHAIQDGVNGRLLPADRPAAWAAAIESAAADAGSVARMSEACVRWPVRGIDEDAAELVGLYRRVLAGRA